MKNTHETIELVGGPHNGFKCCAPVDEQVITMESGATYVCVNASAFAYTGRDK